MSVQMGRRDLHSFYFNVELNAHKLGIKNQCEGISGKDSELYN